MASEHASTNGAYPGQYNGGQYAGNGTAASQSEAEKSSQEQIGWYFVEKYYETLSQETQKLHLFYNNKSQFVFGKEAEVSPVILGRTAIRDRIGKLEFPGSKVRIANVDSQPTDNENIVIQVIGEILHAEDTAVRKFVQTFVLAKQANGYFVLNDIFRYLNEMEAEDQEAPAAEPVAEPATPDAVEEPVAIEEPEAPKVEEPVEESKAAVIDADLVDKKLESALASESATEAPITNGNGVTKEADKAKDAPAAAAEPEVSLTPEVVEKEVEEEIVKEQEKPQDPSPTPAPVAAPPKPVTPAQPAAPAKPLSWAEKARLAASGATKPVPVVPAPAKAARPVQPRAAPAAPAPASTTAAQPTPPASESADKDSAAQSQGWQTAGNDQKRQARPQSVSSPLIKEDTLGYVRNVTEKVNVDELKATLGKFGELVYFDVNRSKNCAFVEFAEAAGYSAAAAANPHVLGGENVMVEPRRPKAAAYGGSGYNNNNRGSMNSRGRGNYDQPRPGRGGFIQRGRGGPASAPRGTGQRPASQTTAA